MAEYRVLGVGDPAPWFTQRSTSSPDYHFDTVAGRYVVLCFFGSSGDAVGSGMLKILSENRDLFDDEKMAFFGVSADPADEKSGGVKQILPGIRHFWDFDLKVSRIYGAAPESSEEKSVALRRLWMVLDPTLRVRR